MAGRYRPSPWQMVWKSFWGSFRKRQEKVLMGEDYLGNRYFEYATPQSGHRKFARFLEPVNKKMFDLDLESRWEEIPPEWEAWLRNKRKDPPTAEEIQANIQMMLQKQENAARLMSERMKELTHSSDPSPVDPDAKVPFPKYEEYDPEPTKPVGRFLNDPVVRDRTIR